MDITAKVIFAELQKNKEATAKRLEELKAKGDKREWNDYNRHRLLLNKIEAYLIRVVEQKQREPVKAE